MTTKDKLNQGYVPAPGIHRFEQAGLGKAPFRCVGYELMVYVACQGAPAQPGGTCDFCGQAIMHAFAIESSDGKRFKVGSDCVNRTGDRGLLRACKNSPEYRAMMRQKAAVKAQEVGKELLAYITALRPVLEAKPHAFGFVDRKTGAPMTEWDRIDWLFNHCGAAGKAQLLRGLKKTYENPLPSAQ